MDEAPRSVAWGIIISAPPSPAMERNFSSSAPRRFTFRPNGNENGYAAAVRSGAQQTRLSPCAAGCPESRAAVQNFTFP